MKKIKRNKRRDYFMTNSNNSKTATIGDLQLNLGLDIGFGFIKAIAASGCYLESSKCRKGVKSDINANEGVQIDIDGASYVINDNEKGSRSVDDYYAKITDISTTIFAISAIAKLAGKANSIVVNCATGLPAQQFKDANLREQLKQTILNINNFKEILINGVKKKIVINNVFVARQGGISTILKTVGLNGKISVIDIGSYTINNTNFNSGKINETDTIKRGIKHFYSTFRRTLDSLYFKEEDKIFNFNYGSDEELMLDVTKNFVIGKGKEFSLNEDNPVAKAFKQDIDIYTQQILDEFGNDTFNSVNSVVLSGGGALKAIRTSIAKLIENENVITIDEIEGIFIDKSNFNLSQFLNAINYFLLLNAKLEL